jgi:mono/diheme cytochrome c family protein
MHHCKYFQFVGAALVAAVAGCAESDSPQFHLDRANVIAKQIAPDHQQAIANILGAMFGTPDQPFALPETGLNQRKLTMSAGPVWSDEEGGKHGLYRRHCAHCHGISGDGHGPTAAILNPYPRDYRPGVFKFKSTQTAAQPTDDDLHRIIHDGVPGTAMPSFALLPPDEIEALVEYVKYLSMRGQMETALVNFVFDEGFEADNKLDPATDPDLKAAIMGDLLTSVLEGWQGAAEQVIVPEEAAIPADRKPEELARSVAEGRELFFGKGQCLKCHGPTALGDGEQSDYDIWSKANVTFAEDTAKKLAEIQTLRENLQKAPGDEAQDLQQQIEAAQKEYEERVALEAHLLPPRNAIPRNLRDGIYRGGRRPLDIFWRISAGIAGTPMPSAAATGEGAAGLSQQEIWKVVDYVQSLPFEPISKPQTRPINTDSVN